MKLELRDYQRESVEAVLSYWAGGGGNPLVEMPTGCHARGTKILMHDGSLKTVEDVRVGDLLMGPDSSPRRVMRLCRGREAMYRIKTLCGESFDVNAGHVLHLQSTNEGKQRYKCYKTGKETVDITVSDYVKKSDTFKRLHKLTKASMIFFPARQKPLINAYFLGALLGDGSTGATISITTMDDEIAAVCTGYAGQMGCLPTVKRKPGNKAYAVLFSDARGAGHHRKRGAAPNPLRKALRDYGLINVVCAEKFIPDDYKLGSASVRLQVLAGLLDTDGHLSNGYFDYVTKSLDLAQDVCFIARSLGFRCSIPKKKVVRPTPGNNGGSYWRLSISGNIEIIPTFLLRKQAGARKQKKSPLKTGFSVTRRPSASYYGFELDGDHLYLTSDFIVHHNSGKSLTMASLMQHLLQHSRETRIVLLSHVQELVEQDADAITKLWPEAPIGIYSAGLGRKDGARQIVFASVQSAHKNIDVLGDRHVVLIDEAHLLSRKDDGQYQQILQALRNRIPQMRVAGFTATPFRTDSGLLTEGWRETPPLFDEIVHKVSLIELLRRGLLCPIVPYAPKMRFDVSKVKKCDGDFVQKALQEAIDKTELSERALEEVFEAGANRDGWLIFAAGVEHATHLRDIVRHHGIDCQMILGKTRKGERREIIQGYKAGHIRALVGNNVLCTGFDAPHISLIAMMRPTASKGLNIQMWGRGFRLHPSKTECLGLDFAGNTLRHGPLDTVDGAKVDGGSGEAPAKECPECSLICHASARACANGHPFPIIETPKFAATPFSSPILSIQEEPMWIDVDRIIVRRHRKEGKPDSLRIDYATRMMTYSMWLALESETAGGYVRRKYQHLFYSGEPPHTVEEAILNVEDIRIPGRIQVMKEGQYWRVIQHDFSVPPGKVITVTHDDHNPRFWKRRA